MRKLLLIVTVWLASITAAVAENATSVPGYTIHHNALTTDTLSPEIARAYGIQRSKNRGMVSISVIQGGRTIVDGQPVAADIKVHSQNLTGQAKEIAVKEVKEGNAVYYIGDFRIHNEETLTFDLQVKPAGSDQVFAAQFRQQFYTE
jgi:hypothetical protein